MILSFAFITKAQTSVTITSVMDSTNNWQYCPPPITTDLLVYGSASGYNYLTDSIDVHVFWGDGSDSLTTVPLTSGGGAGDYFYVWSGLDHVYNLPGTYNIMVIASGFDGSADTSYYPVTVYAGCSLIDGYCYLDNNSNCIFDAGDDTLSGILIEIQNSLGTSIGYGFTDANGYYSVSVPSGLTGLTIAPNLYYSSSFNSVTCPAGGLYTFNSSTGNTFNFGLDCSNSNHDLWVYAGGWIAPPGSAGFIYVYGANYSCTSVNGTITLTLPAELTYGGISNGPAPTSVVGNTITWNQNFIGSGYWNNWFNASIIVNTDTNAVLFDTVCFTASISPTAGDLNPANNTDNECRIIGGPYDPNDKQVSPAGIGSNGAIAPNTVLTYTVNFQNTGTMPALHVYVMDTISNNLDMSTLEILGASHTMNPYIYNTNLIRFDFPNINLPDSNSNEPASHGWIVYRIKVKSNLVNGDEIKNTAHIYFDYNSAIVTNTTLNTIDVTLGMNSVAKSEMENMLFPNPANDNFSVRFEKEISGYLYVYDATGRVVKSAVLNKTTTTHVNVSDLAPGIYNISIPGVELKQNRLQVIH